MTSSPRPPPSPRFSVTSSPSNQMSFSPVSPVHSQNHTIYSSAPQSPASFNPPSPACSGVAVSSPTKSVTNNAHPLLTPSGRAFAVGGRVQNISSDPLSPCIMYWPDNEPYPDQGQIRPSGLVGIPQPPILNTGNRGPISHVRPRPPLLQLGFVF